MDIAKISSEQGLLEAARKQAEEAGGMPDDPEKEEAWMTAFLRDEDMLRIGVRHGYVFTVCAGLVLEVLGCQNESRLEGPDAPQPSGKWVIAD